MDKLDYLNRDVIHCGYSRTDLNTVDYDRIITNSRVLDNMVCYNVDIVPAVVNVYEHRMAMFKSTYVSQKGQTVELMFRDALVKADPVLRFLDKLNDPEEYCKLTDSTVLDRIKDSTDP